MEKVKYRNRSSKEKYKINKYGRIQYILLIDTILKKNYYRIVTLKTMSSKEK